MSSPRVLLRAIPLLIGAAALAGVVAAGRSAALAPAGYLPHPAELIGLGLLLLGISLYPTPLLGSGEVARLPAPGPGTAVVPPIILLYGAVPAATVAALAVLLMRPAHRALARHGGLAPGEDRWLAGAIEGGGVAALATLAGAGAWLWLAPEGTASSGVGDLRWAATVTSGAVYLAVLAPAFWFHDRRLASAPRVRPAASPGGWQAAAASLAAPLAAAATGWLFGVIVAGVAELTHRTMTLVLIAPIAVLAFEAARHRLAWEGTRQRLSGFDAVRRAGHRMVASGREMGLVVEQLFQECREVVPFDWFQFELVAPEVEARDWGAGPGGHIFEGRPEPPSYPRARPGFHRRTPWRRVEHELEAEGVRVARLTLWCDPRRLGGGELRLLESLLPQMAASVHRALLDREAKEDPLTGVAVRRVLERRLTESYQLARNNGGSFAVILCDLDHFKRINDTFGHPTGDRALVAAARALEGALRSRDDLLARYGGEEFTVLLEDADGATALAVAERLRRALEGVELREEGELIPLTLSAGVASFPEVHVSGGGELLLLADGALYEAKRQGRNRCLLDLGQGRYRSPDGEIVEAEHRPEPPEPPRFFS